MARLARSEATDAREELRNQRTELANEQNHAATLSSSLASAHCDNALLKTEVSRLQGCVAELQHMEERFRVASQVCLNISVYVSADTSVRPPRNVCILIINSNIYRIEVT